MAAWTQKLMLAGCVGLAGLFVVGRINGKSAVPEGPASGSPIAGSPMRGATYATAIPLYPGAKLTGNMGGNYYDDLGGPVTFTSESWFFEVSATRAKLADFYRKSLPAANPAETDDSAALAFEWIPPRAVEGETVTVRIRDGELQIGETVKAKAKSNSQ